MDYNYCLFIMSLRLLTFSLSITIKVKLGCNETNNKGMSVSGTVVLLQTVEPSRVILFLRTYHRLLFKVLAKLVYFILI